MKKPTFYFLMAIFVFLLTPFLGMHGAPSVVFRMLYLFGVIMVTCRYDKDWLPAVVTMLFTISKFGYSVAYMPTDIWYYIVLFVGFCFVTAKKVRNLPLLICFFFIWVCLIDILNSLAFYDNSLSLVLLILIFIASGKIEPKKNAEMFSLCFMIISFVISLEYIFAADNIVSVYADVASVDDARVMWADPNYLGCVVSMGALIATSNILTKGYGFYENLFCITVTVLSFIMLLMNASRGALLAFLIGFSILFFTTKVKLAYKIFLLVAIAIFAYWLYDNAYFELIENRIANDSGGGSGRTDIWANKMKAFLDKNIIEKIIGIGYVDGYKLAQAVTITNGKLSGGGFHNEFIAHLVDYGVCGLILVLSFLLYPIRLSKKLNSLVVSHVILLVVFCLTLEPLSLGMYIYYAFWFYIVQKSKEIQENEKYS